MSPVAANNLVDVSYLPLAGESTSKPSTQPHRWKGGSGGGGGGSYLPPTFLCSDTWRPDIMQKDSGGIEEFSIQPIIPRKSSPSAVAKSRASASVTKKRQPAQQRPEQSAQPGYVSFPHNSIGGGLAGFSGSNANTITYRTPSRLPPIYRGRNINCSGNSNISNSRNSIVSTDLCGCSGGYSANSGAGLTGVDDSLDSFSVTSMAYGIDPGIIGDYSNSNLADDALLYSPSTGSFKPTPVRKGTRRHLLDQVSAGSASMDPHRSITRFNGGSDIQLASTSVTLEERSARASNGNRYSKFSNSDSPVPPPITTNVRSRHAHGKSAPSSRRASHHSTSSSYSSEPINSNTTASATTPTTTKTMTTTTTTNNNIRSRSSVGSFSSANGTDCCDGNGQQKGNKTSAGSVKSDYNEELAYSQLFAIGNYGHEDKICSWQDSMDDSIRLGHGDFDAQLTLDGGVALVDYPPLNVLPARGCTVRLLKQQQKPSAANTFHGTGGGSKPKSSAVRRKSQSLILVNPVANASNHE